MDVEPRLVTERGFSDYEASVFVKVSTSLTTRTPLVFPRSIARRPAHSGTSNSDLIVSSLDEEDCRYGA